MVRSTALVGNNLFIHLIVGTAHVEIKQTDCKTSCDNLCHEVGEIPFGRPTMDNIARDSMQCAA